jgi:hypothetical protein
MLASYKLVLSVGHDEYWSTPMRDNLEAFIGKGGNVAFFSGNTCCWQVRSEDGRAGLDLLEAELPPDPVFQTGDYKLLSTAWSHHLSAAGEPAHRRRLPLGRLHRSHGQFMDGDASLHVHRPDHWLYEGTGLKRGDRLAQGHHRRLRVRRLRARVARRPALRHAQRRHAEDLRSPRHLPRALAPR